LKNKKEETERGTRNPGGKSRVSFQILMRWANLSNVPSTKQPGIRYFLGSEQVVLVQTKAGDTFSGKQVITSGYSSEL